jgi:hypothetical protein
MKYALAKNLDSSAPSAEDKLITCGKEIAAHDNQGCPRQPRLHQRDLQA